MNSKYYSNLDYLRLALALEVVATHTAGFTQVLSGAVPTFVCLSGFLIPGSFESAGNWATFAGKRIRRVVPAFVASLVLVAALLGLPGLVSAVATYLTAGLLAYGGAGNGALWSLMVEEVAYASHAISRIAKLKQYLWTPATILCLAITAVVFWRYAIVSKWQPESMRIFAALAAYWAGNLLYFNKEKLQSMSWLVFLGGLFIAYWVGTKHFDPLVDLACSPAMAALVVMIAWRAPQLPRIPDISYGIYVYHAPIWVALYRLHQPRSLFGPVLLFVVPTAILSWYLIEKPILRAKRGSSFSPAPIAVPAE
jgi:peptidoglycan/LPS O-acetylase OafA/YrhL